MCAGAQLLMCYHDQDYAEALTTDQCNKFLRLCVADITHNVIYPEAELANIMLLTHMADTQQPAPDMTSFALNLDSMLLSLSQQHENGSEQANKVLLSLYSRFLPLLHSQFSASADTCVVYTRTMAAFRHINNLPAAFQVFLLMVQNQVEGLTPECCEEVLELLMADGSSALWDYVIQHCGGSFLELLAAQMPSKDAVIQLPPLRSLPTLTMWASPNGSVQRLSVSDGPTPAWMLPAWQRLQPDNAADCMTYSSTDSRSVTHASEASNGHGDGLADQSQPNCASDSAQTLRVVNSRAMHAQALAAMSKPKVSSIIQFVCTIMHFLLFILTSSQRLSGCPLDNASGVCTIGSMHVAVCSYV